jgi:hypothetical protein
VYFARLAGRCVVFVLCALLCWRRPEEFEILGGMNFFRRLSPLHLLWGIWVLDMIAQLTPVGKNVALGSQKIFRQRFRPAQVKGDPHGLRRYIRGATRSAYLVFLLWLALGIVIGVLYHGGILDRMALFMLTVTFYVCDLICVLIWCPFRLLMNNRCCTTCRIFNWDHLMMFTPMALIPGFYSLSLFILSLAVWCVWEMCVLLHPERFWENSNDALKCVNCTDKLCTQYCQKTRK